MEDFVLDKAVDVTLSLMTATEPTVQTAGVRIGKTLLIFDQKQLKATVEKIAITDEAMKQSWNDAVYRLKLSSVGPRLQEASGIWSCARPE